MKKFTINSHGTTFDFDPAKWSEEFIQSMVEQGVKIRVDRASSSLTKDSGATDEERLEKATEVAKSLQDGNIPAGGGAKLTDDQKALKVALKATLKAEGVEYPKEDATNAAGKAIKREVAVEVAISQYTEAMAEAQDAEYTAEMDQTIVDALRQSKAYKLKIDALKKERESVTNGADMTGISLKK